MSQGWAVGVLMLQHSHLHNPSGRKQKDTCIKEVARNAEVTISVWGLEGIYLFRISTLVLDLDLQLWGLQSKVQ